MAFLDLAREKNIIPLILPPHSTHRLQPLDVGLFGPILKAIRLCGQGDRNRHD